MRAALKSVLLCGTLEAGLALSGCVADDGFGVLDIAARAPTSSDELAPAPIPSRLPWQLTPASTASIAQGEKTVVVADPRFGRIKGTLVAVANLDKPLIAFSPRGPIVTACKETIEPQAKGIGAFSVQAAAAGPARRTADGDQVQQIFFRIIYDRPTYLEIRQSALLCKLDRQGRLVDAQPL